MEKLSQVHILKPVLRDTLWGKLTWPGSVRIPSVSKKPVSFLSFKDTVTFETQIIFSSEFLSSSARHRQQLSCYPCALDPDLLILEMSGEFSSFLSSIPFPHSAAVPTQLRDVLLGISLVIKCQE